MSNSVLVVGGGIAGIQASIDLANMGFPVYLVEKTPSIGGRMAQLDKTFPTNDCAMCILAPKMIEAGRHPAITLLTYSELENINGEAGNFTVTIRKRARYVDEDRCTGCGTCQEKCPWKVDSEFNLGIGKRKAIYTPFAQAVPNIPVIDKAHCAYFRKGTCRACEKVCTTQAINFEQEDELIEVEAGSIIIATGLEQYDISRLPEYGYGKIPDVISALEYERLTSASGPTTGELKRPSDGMVPSSIAFIQCVGSRDFKHNAYCSSVCCMHATKEAMLAHEHHPDTESVIFYTDMRAVGKRFQEYITRAREGYNVTYIRSRPGKIESAGNGNLIIWYEDTTTGETRRRETELVILCPALVPSGSTEELARISGINRDKFGFVATPDKLCHPLDTSRRGIFVCGYVHSPRDIPDAVAQASGAAARATEVIAGGIRNG
ncbi:FAD-dependent oxidoreductase [Chloroflexota bacterium]